jgi:hypothetical protein
LNAAHVRPDQFAAWKALLDHKQAIASTTMRELFAADPQRFAKMSREAIAPPPPCLDQLDAARPATIAAGTPTTLLTQLPMVPAADGPAGV